MSIYRILILCMGSLLWANGLFAQKISYGSNDAAGRSLTVDDVTLYYEVYGEGPPVLLLHGGLYGYINEFAGYIDELRSRYTVIAPAMRGHGRSELGTKAFSNEQQAAEAFAILQAVTNEPATVIGFSHGAKTAYTLAATYPKSVRKLVAIGNGVRGSSKSIGWANGMTPAKFIKENAGFVEGRTKLMKDPKRWVEFLDKLFAYYGSMDALTLSDELVKAIRCPVLIVGGDRDWYLPIEIFADAHERIADSRLLIVPDCGHVDSLKRESVLRDYVIPFLPEVDESLSLQGIESIDEYVGKLEQRVPVLQKEFSVPGVSVAVIHGGELAWTKGFGILCQGKKKAIDSDSVMEACSLSKPFFAYMVLKLVEAGDFDLDKPLVEYLGEDYLRGNQSHRKITARMVLTHQTGLPNWRKGGTRNMHHWKGKELELGGPMKLLFEPGEKVGYSGEGFVMLQRTLEKLTGKKLSAWSEEMLISPLGLKSTSFVWQDGFSKNAARGHNSKGKENQHGLFESGNAAASLYTSAEDYARFLLEIMSSDRSGSHSLSSKTIGSMLTPSTVVDGETFKLGLAWGVKDEGEHPMVFHTGSNGSGFRCLSAFFPDSGDGLVVMTNAVGGQHLHEALLEELHAKR